MLIFVAIPNITLFCFLSNHDSYSVCTNRHFLSLTFEFFSIQSAKNPDESELDEALQNVVSIIMCKFIYMYTCTCMCTVV